MTAFAAKKKIKKIGLRQFNRSLYTEIKELPLIVTKNHEPYLLVMRYPKDVENIDNASLQFIDNAQFYPKALTKEEVATMYQDANGRDTREPSFWQKIKQTLNKKIL
jgi:hypothetical protein